MNSYHTDSGLFFKEVSIKINAQMNRAQVVQQTMSFALGLKRTLKAILFDINPTYVLIEPSFKNSVNLFYKHKLISPVVGSKDILENPNGDVLTFKNSLLRALYFSATAKKYKNTLFKIADARDIIAHNNLSYLNINDLRLTLQRDFYPMLKSFSDELGIKPGHYFAGASLKISKISSELQDNLEDKIKLVLETHTGKWYHLKGSPGFIADKDSVTNEILGTDNKAKQECPACKNDAVLYLKPIYDTTGVVSNYGILLMN